MQVKIIIETRTQNAYRVIRVALINSGLGTYAAIGLILHAYINSTDYPLLVDTVYLATKKANIDQAEFCIRTTTNKNTKQ